MATVERTTTIAAPVADIWAVLADFPAISGWAPNVDHSCLLSDQTEGVGTLRRIQSGRMTVVETVEHWEPEVSLRYRITGLPAVIRSVTNTWRLEPRPRSTSTTATLTTVTLTTQIDAGPRPPQQGIAKVVGRKLGQASDQMLAGLEEHMSGRNDKPTALQEASA